MTPSASTVRPEPLKNPWETSGWLMWAVWMVFLAFPLQAALTEPAGVGARVVAILLVVLFGAVYALGSYRLGQDRLPMLSQVWLLLLTGIAAASAVVIGWSAVSFLPFLMSVAMFALPRPLNWWVGVSMIVGLAIVLTVTHRWEGWAVFVMILFSVGIGTGVGRIMADKEQAYSQARETLSISTERERVARDVHDILGHSLTVVTVKAELAERLVETDPGRARAELADIQELTRQALSEIRATVGGLRAAVLTDEIENARVILRGAGVDAQFEADPEVVEHRLRPIVAWVLREAVTNVVRHAQATECAVTLHPGGVTVVDDGAGLRGRREGNGLRGLRERVEASGGRFTVKDAHPGTRVEAQW